MGSLRKELLTTKKKESEENSRTEKNLKCKRKKVIGKCHGRWKKGEEISELEDRTKEMKLGGDWRGGQETAQGPE